MRACSIAAGHELDQRAVVERPGQGVAIDRVDQRLGLAGDPALRRSEDQVQHDGRDQSGRHGHQGHVRRGPTRTRRGSGAASRQHADDRADLAVGDEREVFAHDVWPPRAAGRPPRSRPRRRCRPSRSGRSAPSRSPPTRARWPRATPRRWRPGADHPGRRTSTRRIWPGAHEVGQPLVQVAWRSGVRPAGPRSSGDRLLVTNRRTSAASAPTVELSVVAEKSAETSAAWVTEVRPTITRKIP